jgi:hypothetical protein
MLLHLGHGSPLWLVTVVSREQRAAVVLPRKLLAEKSGTWQRSKELPHGYGEDGNSQRIVWPIESQSDGATAAMLSSLQSWRGGKK